MPIVVSHEPNYELPPSRRLTELERAMLDDALRERDQFRRFQMGMADRMFDAQIANNLLGQRLGAQQQLAAQQAQFAAQRDAQRADMAAAAQDARQREIEMRADAQRRNAALQNAPAAGMDFADDINSPEAVSGALQDAAQGMGGGLIGQEQPPPPEQLPAPPPPAGMAPSPFLETPPQTPAPPEAIADTQQRIETNKQILQAPAQRQRDDLQQKIAAGDPAAVQEGLRRGMLRFSDRQKSEITRIREAMSAVDQDPTMSPADRVRAQRILAEQLAAIRPQEVPQEEQPVDFAQAVQERIATIPHPTIPGRQMMVTVDRNGVPKEFITEAEKARIKVEADLELERRKAELGIGKSGNESAQKKKDAATGLYDKAIKALQERQNEDGTPIPYTDDDIRAEMHRQHQENLRRQEFEDQFRSQLEAEDARRQQFEDEIRNGGPVPTGQPQMPQPGFVARGEGVPPTEDEMRRRIAEAQSRMPAPPPGLVPDGANPVQMPSPPPGIAMNPNLRMPVPPEGLAPGLSRGQPPGGRQWEVDGVPMPPGWPHTEVQQPPGGQPDAQLPTNPSGPQNSPPAEQAGQPFDPFGVNQRIDEVRQQAEFQANLPKIVRALATKAPLLNRIAEDMEIVDAADAPATPENELKDPELLKKADRRRERVKLFRETAANPLPLPPKNEGWRFKEYAVYMVQYKGRTVPAVRINGGFVTLED